MICPTCRDNAHRACASGTWCDCQHQSREDGVPAGAVRELSNVKLVSYGPVTGTGAPGSKIISTAVTRAGAGPRSVANAHGLNGGGLANGGTGTAQLHTLTHWWFDCNRWVGAL